MEFDNVEMIELAKDGDFTQGGGGQTTGLVINFESDIFQRDGIPRVEISCLVDNTICTLYGM